MVTNHPTHDPDIQHIPFFAISPAFLNSLYSTYYDRVMRFDGASKFLLAVQPVVLLCDVTGTFQPLRAIVYLPLQARNLTRETTMDVVGGDYRYCVLLDVVHPRRDGMRRLEGKAWLLVAVAHGCQPCTCPGMITHLPLHNNPLLT